MELCGWGRIYATRFRYGTGMGLPGTPMPDLDNAGCILFWGYNPSLARLTHATATVAALKRGARLIVVDPRRAGLGNKADVWLRVRPGSDGALALGIANIMIERGWYDRAFVRDWTNGPLLVRADNGRLLRERDQVERSARLLWESRPVSYYAWSGVEQQSNATQIFRAISMLYALTGSFDAQGGNVLFPTVPTGNVAGED